LIASCPGLIDGLGSGFMISLPAVINFAHGPLKEKVVMECLRGEKRICLAITEPIAGSDVANIVVSELISFFLYFASKFVIWFGLVWFGLVKNHVLTTLLFENIFSDQGQEVALWQILHCLRHQEVDHQRNIL
jgi:hypothetical protein